MRIAPFISIEVYGYLAKRTLKDLKARAKGPCEFMPAEAPRPAAGADPWLQIGSFLTTPKGVRSLAPRLRQLANRKDVKSITWEVEGYIVDSSLSAQETRRQVDQIMKRLSRAESCVGVSNAVSAICNHKTLSVRAAGPHRLRVCT
jgi:hypothetical protein